MPDPGLPLSIAGGFMSERGNRKQQQAIGKAGDWLMGHFEGIAGDVDDRYEDLLGQYSDLMMGPDSGYTAAFNTVSEQLGGLFSNMISQYTEGRAGVLAEADRGIEQHLASIDRSTQHAQRSAAAQQAFTGLGNTSFGQAQIGAIGAEGARQRGMAQEQYAMTRAGILGETTAGLAGLHGAQITSTQGLGQQYMGGMQAYASSLASMQQAQTGLYANLMGQPAQSVYGGMMQAAQIPTGSGFWGPQLAGIGSGLSGGFA